MKEAHRFNVGVAGLGRAGWLLHVPAIQALGDQFRLSAVCDPDEKRLDEAVRLTGCVAYENYNDFVEDTDIDLVVIATPSHLHVEQTLAALELGKHVLCDKPMALNHSDAVAMKEAAEQANKILTVFHLNHYAPDFKNILNVIESGVLGKIAQIRMHLSNFNRRKDWQTLKKYGGGLLNNSGPHALEQALSFLSKDPERLFFDGRQVVSLGDAEDHVKIVMTSENDPIVDIEISSADASSPNKWTVLGSRGGLWGGGLRQVWKYFDREDASSDIVDIGSPSDRVYHREAFSWMQGEWDHSGEGEPPAVQFYRKLFSGMLHNAPLDVDAARAVRVMQLIDRCRFGDSVICEDLVYESSGQNP